MNGQSVPSHIPLGPACPLPDHHTASDQGADVDRCAGHGPIAGRNEKRHPHLFPGENSDLCACRVPTAIVVGDIFSRRRLNGCLAYREA